jgi:6,7-dimethyl-8-ribityllumazine synthase
MGLCNGDQQCAQGHTGTVYGGWWTVRLRKGGQEAIGFRFGIVVARFNRPVTSKLLGSCIEELRKQGVEADDIEVVRVPGAFEIPLVAKTLAVTKQFDAVICLGAVIRGDTPHFDYISAEASRGAGQAALDTDVPIIFGVLTTDTVAQAIERADPAKYNRGGDAAKSAIDMARAMRMIRETADNRSGIKLTNESDRVDRVSGNRLAHVKRPSKKQ